MGTTKLYNYLSVKVFSYGGGEGRFPSWAQGTTPKSRFWPANTPEIPGVLFLRGGRGRFITMFITFHNWSPFTSSFTISKQAEHSDIDIDPSSPIAPLSSISPSQSIQIGLFITFLCKCVFFYRIFFEISICICNILRFSPFFPKSISTLICLP